jgi:transposase
LPADLDEPELERKIFPPPQILPEGTRPLPDWLQIHQELKGKGMTLFRLCKEYKQGNPHTYQYSWFCQQHRGWTGKLDLVIRQEHRAGERLSLPPVDKWHEINGD